MQWHAIETSLSPSLLESAYQYLWPYAHGFSVKKDKGEFILKAFLFTSSPDALAKKLKKFLTIQTKLIPGTFSCQIIDPFQIPSTQEFIVVPFPAAYTPPFGTPLYIQRGRAFGVGSHPCTVFCLEAIEEVFRYEPRKRIKHVLDAGSGTGILSIAAAKRGADKITCAEISLESVREAEENLRINQVDDKVEIFPCTVTDIKGQYDLVVANLYGALLLEIVSFLAQSVKEKGWLILGGMSLEQSETVLSKYKHQGFEESALYTHGEWCVGMLRKI
jgi:ribosomal protein L11 methyltransferase